VGSVCCSVALQKGLFAIVLQQIKGCIRENKIESGLSKAGSHCGNGIQLARLDPSDTRRSPTQAKAENEKPIRS
jgi:hypothetical protein